MNILVAGLGKLGSVMAALLANAGHTVIGVDLNDQTCAAINRKEAPVDEPGLGALIAGLEPGHLSAVTADRYRPAVDSTDLAMIVVPTPSYPGGGFDPSMVAEAVEEIGSALAHASRPGPYTVVVCSTLMPGTMQQVIAPALEAASGLRVGEGIHLAYSPEFIALGTVIADMTSPDTVLIGTADRRSAEIVSGLSTTFRTACPIRAMSFVEAEITKLAINAYLSMKIGFANMIGAAVSELAGNPHTVLAAIGADSRIGPSYLKPGGPPTGPCLPRDLVALEALGTTVDVGMPLATGARQAARDVVDRIVDRVGPHRRVAILGVAYKPGSNVTDDSLARQLIERLNMAGRPEISVHDPHATLPPSFPFAHKTYDTAAGALADANVVIVGCPHPEFDGLVFGTKEVINPWQ